MSNFTGYKIIMIIFYVDRFRENLIVTFWRENRVEFDIPIAKQQGINPINNYKFHKSRELFPLYLFVDIPGLRRTKEQQQHLNTLI